MSDWVKVTTDQNFSHWSKRVDRFYPINVTHPVLPSAVYEVEKDNDDVPFFREIPFPSDDLQFLPGSPSELIVNQISAFWEKKHLYNKAKLVFKRGILLYGPAGCGKTSIIRLLSNEIISKGGVVVSVDDISAAQDLLVKFRQVEPDRPLMVVFEDIEKLMGKQDDASAILSFLDGEKQLGNVVSIATTNKPDIIDDTLMRRPGRFDIVIGLNPPVSSSRVIYLSKLFSDSSEERIEEIADDTDGFGLAHLRELYVSVAIFDQDYMTTLNRLRANIKNEFKMPKVGQKTVTGYTLGYVPETKDND